MPAAVIVVGAMMLGAMLLLRPRDDVPSDSDAIVVLGGVGQERFDLGLQLADEHDASLVLSSSATYFAAVRGYRCRHVDHCLLDPRTTAEEARAVAALADEQGWSYLTVVTSAHHTTRARILFRQCLGDQVSVIGAPRPGGPSRTDRVRELAGTIAALTVRRAC